MREDQLLKVPAYSTTMRRGWHGYTFPVSVLSVYQPNDGKSLLKRVMPDLSRTDHAKLAEQHVVASIKNRASWLRLIDKTCRKLFGRPYGIADYRISGVGRDDFPQSVKDKLSKMAVNAGLHARLAVLHKMAAGHHHHTALAFCRGLGM